MITFRDHKLGEEEDTVREERTLGAAWKAAGYVDRGLDYENKAKRIDEKPEK